jgi:hypothetical protein
MEEWRQIEGKGNGNYEVSNLGNIRNKKTGRILKQRLNSNGYFYIDLSYDKHLKVHRLIANAFIPNPENKPFIDHIDKNRTNNNMSNLRWATSQENARNRKSYSKTSKYQGVTFDKSKNRFKARIMINRKSVGIGHYKTEEEAAIAYNDYLIKNNLHEFFILNDLFKTI